MWGLCMLVVDKCSGPKRPTASPGLGHMHTNGRGFAYNWRELQRLLEMNEGENVNTESSLKKL